MAWWMSTPSLIERLKLGAERSINRWQSITNQSKWKEKRKKGKFFRRYRLTTLTKSWKVMAVVRLVGRSSWWPPPLQPLLLSSDWSLSSCCCCCRWNFSSSCWILCGSMCWRNSGDRRARPKSSHGISPKPSGSNCGQNKKQKTKNNKKLKKMANDSKRS